MRSISPAPASSTSASARSATTRHGAGARAAADAAARIDRQASAARPRPAPRHAGSRPKTRLVSTAIAAVNAEHASVDGDLVERAAAKRARARRAPWTREHREQHAGDRPAGAQQGALGQQLPDDASAAGAEDRAQRQLALPGDRPRQQQVRDVRAGDQQHEADRRQQHVAARRGTLPVSASRSGTTAMRPAS